MVQWAKHLPSKPKDQIPRSRIKAGECSSPPVILAQEAETRVPWSKLLRQTRRREESLNK